MKPPHRLFFSSLEQVEKRLKLDDGNPPETTQTQATESFSSSPIYLYNQPTNASSTLQADSTEQPAQEFLSCNDFPPTPHKNPPRLEDSGESSTIDSLIQFLRLSDVEGEGAEMADVVDDEFYDKIVQVKGPKCKKEVERLDGWIKYLLNNGRREPLRLTHLLLAKAALGSVDEGLEFPSTVDEFLQNDPPLD